MASEMPQTTAKIYSHPLCVELGVQNSRIIITTMFKKVAEIIDNKWENYL